jgi:hypothetical protein
MAENAVKYMEGMKQATRDTCTCKVGDRDTVVIGPIGGLEAEGTPIDFFFCKNCNSFWGEL